jgi:hypothetical protein
LIDRFVAASILPSNLCSFETVDAMGSSGGILTAWDPGLFSLVSVRRDRFSLSVVLSSQLSGLFLAITNVYAPANHALTPAILAELEALGLLFPLPWLGVGDFNLVRAPGDKNNCNFDLSLATAFNASISNLALFELPLLDRMYTWSNKRSSPVLARLNRAFFNQHWNVALPNSCLTSLHRPTSDHFPLLVSASTNIHRPACFRFENAWLLNPTFLPTTITAWNKNPPRNYDAADLAACLKSFRAAAKVWKRSHLSLPKFETNCKFVIDLLDLFEETRDLSAGEIGLRVLCRDTLGELILARATHWKQRGKFCAVLEGDENTRFFHARASQRLRRNTIRAIDVDGSIVVTHDAKATALFGFYSTLLGQAPNNRWTFDVDALYDGCLRICGLELVAPFTALEIKKAVDSMDRSSAPSPDGLGPSFYRAAWASILPQVIRLFDAFHAGNVDLDSIKQAHVVLLPKKPGTPDPGAFRPISLQNCSVKILCKVLTSRLQVRIGDLIDIDQTGFLADRSISENFVYAMELMQTCFRRRTSCVVLKLDFAKAFDSVSWSSLWAIMLARGFPTLWCDWMDMIFSSSRSAIMLNGVPGKWIRCMRGLRQGDPLSPYLFLITADVLQRLIKLDAGILHPITDGVPCPVLQYADDTLIIMRADAGAARRLWLILQQFEQATGLRINYHKSTLVPMHIAPELLSDIQDCLQCRVEGFPQTYLGLPLSAQKLRLDAFAPLIAKVDKYLSGWRSLLLSPGGRLILLNSVLDALPAYAMGAMELPAGLLDALDKLRCSFLWAPTDRASGAKCLVAWDLVCRPKEAGGVGVRDLRIQNKCLQMKLLHRLHSVPGASWPR